MAPEKEPWGEITVKFKLTHNFENSNKYYRYSQRMVSVPCGIRPIILKMTTDLCAIKIHVKNFFNLYQLSVYLFHSPDVISENKKKSKLLKTYQAMTVDMEAHIRSKVSIMILALSVKM